MALGSTSVTGGAFIGVMLVLGAATVFVLWLAIRARKREQVPLHPEALRKLFDRQAAGPSAGEKAAMMMMHFVFVIPGMLLVLLAESSHGRFMGAALIGWATLHTLLGHWYRRSGRLEAAQQKALADSEAFWSRPDAEDRARDIRRSPFGRPATR